MQARGEPWQRMPKIIIGRSEGEAERDIGSPCMIGLGLVVVDKFFRRRRRRRPPGGGEDPRKSENTSD